MDISAIKDRQDLEQELSPGVVLDSLLRKVSVYNLVDYLLSSYISAPQKKVQLFFAKDTPIDSLQELRNSMDFGEFSLALEETTLEGAGFVLTAIGDVEEETPTDADAKGTVDIDVDLTGEVDVK